MKKIFTAIFILFLLTLLVGCAVTGSALTTAAYKGQTNVVKDLLDKGADVNERSGCGLGSDPNLTALICAVTDGHIETVKVLVARGADVNVTYQNGWTPLAYVAYKGNAGIAKLLIEKGADIDTAMAQLEKYRSADGIKFLERIAKNQQPSRQTETMASQA